MKSPVWTLEFLNAEKTRQLKGGHWEIVLTYKGADYTVGLYRHAVQVVDMLKNGDIDGAKAFCNGDIVKSGKNHRDTTEIKAEKAAADVVAQKKLIANLKRQLAEAIDYLKVLENAEHTAKIDAIIHRQEKQSIAAERSWNEYLRLYYKNARQEKVADTKAKKVESAQDKIQKNAATLTADQLFAALTTKQLKALIAYVDKNTENAEETE